MIYPIIGGKFLYEYIKGGIIDNLDLGLVEKPSF